MTPSEMRQILSDLSWSQNDLARFSGRGTVGILKQARGKVPIDRALAWWLRSLHFLVMNPPPAPPYRPAEAARQPQDVEAALAELL
jgi:hypothetical protein